MRSLEQMPIKNATPTAWISAVLGDFDHFLLDHAACERKAAALAMSLVMKYPDRPTLIEPMICLAREELAHFHDVYRLIAKRGLSLQKGEKDPYLNELLKHVRHSFDDHLLDRLLVGAVVEARGCERFKIVAENLTEPELAAFYQNLAKVEAGHYKIFFRVAEQFFPTRVIEERLDFFLEEEATLIDRLPLRAVVH